MLSRYLLIFYFILICLFTRNTFAEMTIEKLIFDEKLNEIVKLINAKIEAIYYL